MQKLLTRLPKFKIKSKIPPSLPQTPGIYIFFNNLKVIYIGKAINLKRRISSYFDLKLEAKTARIVKEANFISYIKVASELEALLLSRIRDEAHRFARRYHHHLISKVYKNEIPA